MYKNNSRDSSKFKGYSSLQLCGKLKVTCHVVGYYSYVRQEVAYYNCLTFNSLCIGLIDDQTLCSITSSLGTHAYRVTGLCEAVPTI